MRLWTPISVASLVGGIALVIVGCQSPPAPHVFDDATTSGDWLLWPQSMRVHPLTRVIAQANTEPPIVEMRVEFVDPIGHPIKSTGQMAITYNDSTGSIRNVPPIGLWETDLRDLEVNRSHWDDVTETYLYRFPLPKTATGKSGMLRVIMLQEDGQQFDDVFALEIPDTMQPKAATSKSINRLSEPSATTESTVLRQEMRLAMLDLIRQKQPDATTDGISDQVELAIVEIRSGAPDFLMVSAETEEKLHSGSHIDGADQRIAGAEAFLAELELPRTDLVQFLLDKYQAGNLSPKQTELLAQLIVANMQQVKAQLIE